jgi:hypothetical protein
LDTIDLPIPSMLSNRASRDFDGKGKIKSTLK